jgi:hypothetical protein
VVYPQSKDNFNKSEYEMLDTQPFIAQGSRLIIVVVQVLGAVNLYIRCSSSGGAQEKGKTG